MTQDNHDEIELLQRRIDQLQFLQEYLKKIFAGEPFEVEIKISILGNTELQKFPYINPKYLTLKLMQWEEDSAYLLKCLDSRIEVLTNKKLML